MKAEERKLLEILKLKKKQTEVWKKNLKLLTKFEDEDHKSRSEKELQNARGLLKDAQRAQHIAQQNYDSHRRKNRQAQKFKKQGQRLIGNISFKVGDEVQVNNKQRGYLHNKEGVVSYAPEGRFVKGTNATMKTSYNGLQRGAKVTVRNINEGKGTVNVQGPGGKITKDVKKTDLSIVDEFYVVRIEHKAWSTSKGEWYNVEKYLNFKNSELLLI